MVGKQHTTEENDIAAEWIDKWFQLVLLLYDLIGMNEDEPCPLPPPSDLDEINYQNVGRQR